MNYENLELIAPEGLPPTSPLGQLYARYIETPNESRTRQRANELSREAFDLERWLKNATLDTTTPEEFGQAKVRAELLNQTITKYERDVKELQRDSFSLKQKFEDEYTRYRLLVRALRSGEFKDRPEAGKRAYEDVLKMVTPAE